MTDYEKLLDIRNNLEEKSEYFRKKKEDILDYLIEESKTTGEQLPPELHIKRHELNTTFLNEFLQELGYSVVYEEKYKKEVGFYYIVNLT